MTSPRSVWCRETPTGFKHQIFVMFHSTRGAAAAQAILTEGFRNSGGGTLGPGVYCSKDFQKANPYGDITFRLLVYPGKVCKVDRPGHPLQTSWQNTHGSAYLPYKAWGAVLEENCIKSKDQIRILGVCKGYDQLQQQGLTRDLTGRTDHHLHRDEKRDLDQFLVKLNLKH